MDFEFGKNTTVDALEKVPEQFRGFYVQGDGGFTLDEKYKPVATSVDGLNRSLKAARRDADDYKKKAPNIEAYGQLGQLLGLEGDEATNPDSLKSAIERTISESKDGKVNWEKMKGDLSKGFNTQIQAKDAELGAMSKTLQKYLISTAAMQSLSTHKGVPDLLMPHIAMKTKVIKEGDDYVVRVLDEAGDPRGNAAGGFMTVDDLVKEMKASAVFGRAFESEASQGTGTKPGSGMQRQAPKQGEKSSMDKISAGLARMGQR